MSDIKTVINSRTNLESRLRAAVFMVLDLKKKLNESEEKCNWLERCLVSAEELQDKDVYVCFCGLWGYYENMEYCGLCREYCCENCVEKFEIKRNHQHFIGCEKGTAIFCKNCISNNENDILCSHIKR